MATSHRTRPVVLLRRRSSLNLALAAGMTLALSSAATAQQSAAPARKPAPPATPAPTGNVERGFTRAVQLTFPEQFVRAGEAYFNRDATWIVFQAIPRDQTEPGDVSRADRVAREPGEPRDAQQPPDTAADDEAPADEPATDDAPADESASDAEPGEEAPADASDTDDAAPSEPAANVDTSSLYRMYVARIRRGADGVPIGIEAPIQISPPRSANTCGYFHPQQPWRVIFGSTIVTPGERSPAGYQRGTSNYRWQFPSEMEVVTLDVPQIAAELRRAGSPAAPAADKLTRLTPVWTREGYDAECAFSPDGRSIVYTHVDPQSADADIFVFDTRTSTSRPLIVAPGYDGGPFFSPDGSMICYRSDRKGDDLLQIHIAELSIAENGEVLGVKREMPVTANEHVNWAPFWHPTGEYLLYTTSEQGHQNYEIYSVEVPLGVRDGVKPADLKRRRLTSGPGFDGLPAFSTDGGLLLWTSQRGPKLESEERPSSQLWIAVAGDLAP